MIFAIVALMFIFVPLMIYASSVLYVWALAYSYYRDDQDTLTSVALLAIVRPWAMIQEIHKTRVGNAEYTELDEPAEIAPLTIEEFEELQRKLKEEMDK